MCSLQYMLLCYLMGYFSFIIQEFYKPQYLYWCFIILSIVYRRWNLKRFKRVLHFLVTFIMFSFLSTKISPLLVSKFEHYNLFLFFMWIFISFSKIFVQMPRNQIWSSWSGFLLSYLYPSLEVEEKFFVESVFFHNSIEFFKNYISEF